MKYKFKVTFIALLFLNICAPAQSVETRFQSVIDSIYNANPSSVGILVHVESPENGVSFTGASGSPYKDATTKLRTRPTCVNCQQY